MTPGDPPHSGLGTGGRQVTVWLEAPSDGGCGLSLQTRERQEGTGPPDGLTSRPEARGPRRPSAPAVWGPDPAGRMGRSAAVRREPPAAE